MVTGLRCSRSVAARQRSPLSRERLARSGRISHFERRDTLLPVVRLTTTGNRYRGKMDDFQEKRTSFGGGSGGSPKRLRKVSGGEAVKQTESTTGTSFGSS